MLLIRRMDAVASIYRLAASMSPGIDGLRSHVEFHRRGRFDATITLHDGRDFGVVRQGLALRRRSLYDRLRAIAEYDYTRRPDTVLVLVPSVWEQRLNATHTAPSPVCTSPGEAPQRLWTQRRGRRRLEGREPACESQGPKTPPTGSSPKKASRDTPQYVSVTSNAVTSSF